MGGVFKRNILAVVPANAVIVEKDGKRYAKWSESGRNVTREVVATRKGDRVVGGQSREYFGKVRTAPKQWQIKKLYSDKTASIRRLADLQKHADQWDSGVKSEAVEKLNKPIKELRDEYLTDLRRDRKKDDHIKISTFMLDRLIELGDWKYFRDITRDSVNGIAEGIVGGGKTVSYANKFITRAKAFVNHFVPENYPNPLAKLKRIRERGAIRNRARRAATIPQVMGLLTSDIPLYRVLAYAQATLNGLRRCDAASLTRENVHLKSPIPFITLGKKMGDDDTRDAIPLHPFVVSLLQGSEGDEDEKVLHAVPDVATLEKDWKQNGVSFVDAKRRRLDYHGLRHTFSTMLDQTGCSRATKQRLMRHAAEDVTDGYTHAELAEMRAALDWLPHPVRTQPESQRMRKTGTTDTPVDPLTGAHHRQHQMMGDDGSQSGFIGGLTPIMVYLGRDDAMCIGPQENQTKNDERGQLETIDLMMAETADNVSNPRPDTQVD